MAPAPRLYMPMRPRPAPKGFCCCCAICVAAATTAAAANCSLFGARNAPGGAPSRPAAAASAAPPASTWPISPAAPGDTASLRLDACIISANCSSGTKSR